MKVNIDGLFSELIFERGAEYQEDGAVHSIRLFLRCPDRDDISFHAIVNGNESYNVQGVIASDGYVSCLSCTCPYAETDNCKHMAATLLQLKYLIIDAQTLKKRNAFSLLTAVSYTNGSQGYSNRQMYNNHNNISMRHMTKFTRQSEDNERRQLEKENAHREYIKNRKEIFPFLQNSDDSDYKYFDFSRIMSHYTIYDIDFEEAKKEAEIYRNIYTIEFDYYESGTSDTFLAAKASFGHYASVTIGSDRLITAYCNNTTETKAIYQDPVTNKLCPSRLILALLILTNEELEKKNEIHMADYTSKTGIELLNNFHMASAPETVTTYHTSSSSLQVHISPILEFDKSDTTSEYKLRFRIGIGKSYIVKNLTNLVESVQNRQIFPLGKNNGIDFAANTFDSQSNILFQMIYKSVMENRRSRREYEQNYIPHNYYYPPQRDKPLEIKTYINMMPDCWDVLYDFISNNGSVTYNGFRVNSSETDPELRLSLSQEAADDGKLRSVVLSGALPRVINGIFGNYCLIYYEKDPVYILHRVSYQLYKKLRPLDNYQSNGILNIKIGVKHLSDFFFNVLPEMRKLIDIDEKELSDVHKYLPPTPAFSAFLDIENNAPVCRIEAVYGDERFSVFDWDNKEPDATKRCKPFEIKARELVRKYFPYVDAEHERYICGMDDDSLFRLLDEGIPSMSDLFEMNATKEFDTYKVHRPPQVRVGVSIEGDLLSIEVASDEISRQELIALLNSYKLKKKYHRLRNGGFVRLGTEVEDLEELFDALHVTPGEFVHGKMNIPAYRALYLDKMLEACDNLYTTRDQRFRSLIKDFKTVRDSEYEVPVSLRNIMRSYQADGFKWLCTLRDYKFGGILADDMGLGKTIQMISLLLSSRESGSTGPSLIVCPASLVYNWEYEFHRFAPKLKVSAIAGRKSDREKIIQSNASYDALITSYGLLKRDIELYENVRFQCEILDEAQNIKTQSTGSAKSAKLINAAHRFALTGTPIENRLSELWSIFDYLMPGYLYGYETFKREFETPILQHDDESASNRLKKMIAPFILRRLKADVLNDLPEKIEEVRYVRFEKEQKMLYDAQAVRLKNIINSQTDDETKHSKIMILSELMRIRQICCDPSLLFEDFGDISAKRTACIELIQSAISGEHRVLLFSQFTSMLDLLKKDLTQNGIGWYTITGSTPKKERVDLVRKFNEDDTPVFLISLKAGGTGLNLIGADVVIHYDPWWNIAAQNQATDRAHRIGQRRNVCVYKLIVKDTIEENILKLQESKKELAESILNGELGGIAGMSREELLKLIG